MTLRLHCCGQRRDLRFSYEAGGAGLPFPAALSPWRLRWSLVCAHEDGRRWSCPYLRQGGCLVKKDVMVAEGAFRFYGEAVIYCFPEQGGVFVQYRAW